MKFNTEHHADDWRLFIDGSKFSIKAALIHIGNQLPTLPVAYLIQMKETYINVARILQVSSYKEHQWRICDDLKVAQCFICEWDSRDHKNHFAPKLWRTRDSYRIGEKNVINEPLVPKEKIILPPLHTKLGLMTQFVTALKRDDSPATAELQEKFPIISAAKIVAGVFSECFKDLNFTRDFSEDEVAARESFRCVVEGFLGRQKNVNKKRAISC